MNRYGITKVDNPRSADYGKWHLSKYESRGLGIWTSVEVIFTGETRKDCRMFAEKEGIDVAFMDSGRKTGGCKW